eukprot:s1918_g3.t1
MASLGFPLLPELEGLEKDDYKDDDKDSEKADEAPPAPAAAETQRFTPEELEKARKEVDAMMDQDDNFNGYSVAGPLTIHGVDDAVSHAGPPAPAAAVPAANATAASPSRPPKRKAEKVEEPKTKEEEEENPWLSENPWATRGEQITSSLARVSVQQHLTKGLIEPETCIVGHVAPCMQSG